MKPKILCCVDYYLPGYKGGGPIRTIANMVDQLSPDFDFLIITRDRDLGSSAPYENVVVDAWNRVGQATVFYMSPASLSFWRISRLMAETPHDVLYLNSFFSPKATIFPLLARRLGLCSRRSIVVAPRGEFSVGALNLKRLKKSVFIAVANFARLYGGVIWQASSEHEARDVRRVLGRARANIVTTPNMIVVAEDIIVDSPVEVAATRRAIGRVRIIFLSRVSRKKNLHYLLQAMSRVRAEVSLSICGPVEDLRYWAECEHLIGKLPKNITAEYVGEVSHDHVADAFAQHDVFFFPTAGENFGHVIFEALKVGTCVVLSDQTPWEPDVDGAVEVIALEDPEGWTRAIERWAAYSSETFATRRKAALQYVATVVDHTSALERNRNLLLGAASVHRASA